MSDQTCVIVGASHAAAQLAPALRQEGWEGSITVIGEEPYLPYNRPPLSKTFLAGKTTVDELLIRHGANYEKANISFRLGVKASRIDRRSRQLELADGNVLAYDKLALTVGSRVRKVELPGGDLGGICYLRTIDDVQHIRGYTGPGKKAVIVGGGYIGLETAAMLRGMGMEVTVVEMSSRVLNRVTAPQVSAFFTRIHTEEGVRVVTDVLVSEFEGREKVEQVVTAQGEVFPADLVIMGVGILPNLDLAEDAGLDVDNGIVVDAHCRTSDPDIVAAGDCTRYYSPHYRRYIRLESVQNATDQAKIAAATVCGKLKEYNSLPWFWSDQYDLKLQIGGLSQGYDEVIVRGDIKTSRKFAAFYLKNNIVLAVDAVNKPQEFLLGKRIIATGRPIDKERLADDGVAMKELLN